MPANQELDAILRTVDPETSVDPSCQVLVPIDTQTGQPVRPGLWSFLGKKNQKLLLVTNSHRADAVAIRRSLKIGIEDFSQGWHFDLLLDYEARCNPGREIRVAQALWSGPSPQDRLESLLKGWILKRLQGGAADFVRNFDHSARELAEELRTRAFEQTGLTLATRIVLAGADGLDPLRIGPLTLPIRVRDRDDELDLRLEVELAVQPGKERVAFLHCEHHVSMERAVQKKVREHFAAGVTLQQFHSDLTGPIQTDLWRELDELVASYGRQVARLRLGGEAFPGVLETKRVEHRFSYRLRDYPEPVEVKTELLLQLTDLGRYVRAKAPDLKLWADREVEDAAIRSLFGVTYTDLCLHHEEKKAEVERLMKEKAAAIGYELKQLITITDLQFDVLRRPFLVQVEGEFPTRLAKLKVRLEVNATLVVPNPSQIASLLNRRVDIREHIGATLLDRVQQRLHQIDPECFYMEFETPKTEDRSPVRAQIETVIRSTVKEEFHADVLNLSCKQLETEFSRRLERLMAPLHAFEAEVEASRGGPGVRFESSLRVLGVDEGGWMAFQNSNPEPENLRDCAIRHLTHILADEALGRLLQTSNAEQKKYVEQSLRDRILQEYGLRIQVMDWLRRPLKQETEAVNAKLLVVSDTITEQNTRVGLAQKMRGHNQALQIKAAESRLVQLEKLQERLVRVLVVGGDTPEEERELREKIAALQEEQKMVLAEATAERSGAVLPQLRSARGLLAEEIDETPQTRPAMPAAAEQEFN